MTMAIIRKQNIMNQVKEENSKTKVSLVEVLKSLKRVLKKLKLC